MEWENIHDPQCTVTEERAGLLEDMAQATVEVIEAQHKLEAAQLNLQVLYGVYREYDGGGDQEAENCTCGMF